MKRSTVVVALLASLALVGTAEARDPCKTMMCMAGKAGLKGGSLADSDCSGAVSDFFSWSANPVYQPDRRHGGGDFPARHELQRGGQGLRTLDHR